MIRMTALAIAFNHAVEYGDGVRLQTDLVTARIGSERLQDIIPLGIPEGPYETLAGYLLHQMGRIPRRMEQFRSGGIQYVIEDADLKSIRQVQVILPAGPAAAKKDEAQVEPPRPVGGL